MSYHISFSKEPQLHIFRYWRPGGDSGSTGVDRRQITSSTPKLSSMEFWTNGWNNIDIIWYACGYTNITTSFEERREIIKY